MGFIIHTEHQPAKAFVSETGFVADGREILTQFMKINMIGSSFELDDFIFHMVEKLGQGIRQRSIFLLFRVDRNLICHRHLPQNMIISL